MDCDPKTRTIEKLKTGSLPRADREGVPKFPLFMYDEDMIEPGRVTNGLFRGPLLIAAGFAHLGLHSSLLTDLTGLQVYFHFKERHDGGEKTFGPKEYRPDQPDGEG